MDERKRLWVVTELYYPENNQTGYYMTGIAEGLTEKYDVKVICGQPNYAARGTRAAKNDVHRNVEIFRVWSTTLDKNVLPFRLINMLTQGASMFVRSLIKFNEKEDVLVVSAPPTLPFVTALAAKLRRAEYILIIQDKYPETLAAVGKLKSGSVVFRFLNYCNKWLYKNAKKIIVVGRDMRELVNLQLDENEKIGKNRKSGKRRTPVEVIQNWASLEEVEPTPRSENEILQKLNLMDKFVFLYAGNMGHPQDIESVVECAEKLRNDERFHFLFIGSGVKRKWLERTAGGGKLKNVTILDAQPRSRQKTFLNACDVGLVPLVKKMRGVAMPSRTYNILAAGKPVLALTEKNSEVARVIEDDDVGWFVPPREPEQLLRMIRRIYEERDKIPAMAIRARAAAQTSHSLAVAVAKYRKAI